MHAHTSDTAKQRSGGTAQPGEESGFKTSAYLCQHSPSTPLCCFSTGGQREAFELLGKEVMKLCLTIHKTDVHELI